LEENRRTCIGAILFAELLCAGLELAQTHPRRCSTAPPPRTTATGRPAGIETKEGLLRGRVNPFARQEVWAAQLHPVADRLTNSYELPLATRRCIKEQRTPSPRLHQWLLTSASEATRTRSTPVNQRIPAPEQRPETANTRHDWGRTGRRQHEDQHQSPINQAENRSDRTVQVSSIGAKERSTAPWQPL